MKFFANIAHFFGFLCIFISKYEEKYMKKVIYCYAFSLIMLCLCACSEGKSESYAVIVGDTVSLATISLHDTTSYMIGTDERCGISADVVISYPKLYVDKDKTETLQRLFSTSVLGVSSDSASLATAFPQYLENLIARYKENDGNFDEETLEPDYEVMTDCKLTVRTYPVYNAGGLLGFCKEETAVINVGEPSTRHFYYAFDLSNPARIELSDLFPDEYSGKVAEMLKAKLRADMNVTSGDELADMGYYNYDNIVAGDNFYVTGDSIIWNFLPRELSVLEEVRISLSKSAIEMLSNNNR